MNRTEVKQGFTLLLVAQFLMIMCNLLGAFEETVFELRTMDTILVIVSSIISVIAINLIRKNEDNYTKAYHWAYISLSVVFILLILQKVFVDNGMILKLLEDIERVLSDICEFVTASIIIKVSIGVFKNSNKDNLVEYGEKTHSIHRVGFIAGMIMDLIHSILIESFSFVTIAIDLLAFILLIIADIRYFLFIYKVKNNI